MPVGQWQQWLTSGSDAEYYVQLGEKRPSVW